MKLDDHPTVQLVRRTHPEQSFPVSASTLDAVWLRTICLDAGVDDVGFVELARPALADQRDDILRIFPQAQSLISFVVRMNREPIRSPARSVANLEFHHAGERVNDIARKIVAALEARGVRALNPSMGFPMEMNRFPGKIWVISHKPVAVQAGLGQIGIHRNVIHPKFGNFVLLGTIVLDAKISAYDAPIAYNPCLECKLCVAACPTGAIGTDGHFDFSACYTHNYREFMGGFTDWVEQIADSPNATVYRRRVSDTESASMWQSLSFGANYKAAYCLAVCPAGEEVIAPFLKDRKSFTTNIVAPLQDKIEQIYVVPASDAESHVARRFPQKTVKRVGNGLRPRSIDQFLAGLSNAFQRGKAAGLDATYHFTFTGMQSRQATITIRENTVCLKDGHIGTPHLRVIADSDTWLRFVRKEGSLIWALLTRKVRLKGSPRWLIAFGKCFPS
ncbi:MAG TPA: SCP2 sterol-binding domain-containing protein [Nitrospira sp.]|nr:SCP2 sterol-binding domain-containing protein [Nitrospira sp.]